MCIMSDEIDILLKKMKTRGLKSPNQFGWISRSPYHSPYSLGSANRIASWIRFILVSS